MGGASVGEKWRRASKLGPGLLSRAKGGRPCGTGRPLPAKLGPGGPLFPDLSRFCRQRQSCSLLGNISNNKNAHRKVPEANICLGLLLDSPTVCRQWQVCSISHSMKCELSSFEACQGGLVLKRCLLNHTGTLPDPWVQIRLCASHITDLPAAAQQDAHLPYTKSDCLCTACP